MREADDSRGDWRRKAFRQYYNLADKIGQDELPDALIAQVMGCKTDEARRLILGRSR